VWAAGVARRTLDTAGVATTALVHETDSSPEGVVVLVHGFTGSKEDFAALLPELASAGWHAVAIDLPGQHESPALGDPGAEAIGRHVAVVVEHVADEAEADRIHVVGHSLGGLLVRRAALWDQRRFASLTMLCSGPAALGDASWRDPLERFAAAMAAGRADAVWSAMRADAAAAGDDPLPPDVLDFLERRLLSGDPATHAAFARILLDEPDLTDALAALDLATHVVFGDADDAWTPTAQTSMADRLGARRSIIEGAGHSPAVDDPRATAEALIEGWRTPAPRATSGTP
jgi:pimeloyl-ACP methyl ester carboxylesterase